MAQSLTRLKTLELPSSSRVRGYSITDLLNLYGMSRFHDEPHGTQTLWWNFKVTAIANHVDGAIGVEAGANKWSDRSQGYRIGLVWSGFVDQVRSPHTR